MSKWYNIPILSAFLSFFLALISYLYILAYPSLKYNLILKYLSNYASSFYKHFCLKADISVGKYIRALKLFATLRLLQNPIYFGFIMIYLWIRNISINSSEYFISPLLKLYHITQMGDKFNGIILNFNYVRCIHNENLPIFLSLPSF